MVQGSSDLCWGGMKRTVQPDTLPPAAASHRVFKGLEGKSAAIKGQTPKGHAGGAGLVSSPLLPPLRGGQIGPILQEQGVCETSGGLAFLASKVNKYVLIIMLALQAFNLPFVPSFSPSQLSLNSSAPDRASGHHVPQPAVAPGLSLVLQAAMPPVLLACAQRAVSRPSRSMRVTDLVWHGICPKQDKKDCVPGRQGWGPGRIVERRKPSHCERPGSVAPSPPPKQPSLCRCNTAGETFSALSSPTESPLLIRVSEASAAGGEGRIAVSVPAPSAWSSAGPGGVRGPWIPGHAADWPFICVSLFSGSCPTGVGLALTVRDLAGLPVSG